MQNPVRPAATAVPDEDALVRKHLGVARNVSQKMCRTLPLHVDPEEVFAAACEGVLLAIRTWDSTLTSNLRTWCALKARCAVLEWLRQGLNGSAGRTEGKQQFLSARVSLHDYCDSLRPLRYVDVLVGDTALSVSGRVDLADLVAWACRGLLPDERTAVYRYYLDGWDQQQIAVELSLSPTRISQMLTNTLSLLKERLEMHATREESPPRIREEEETRALRELDALGVMVERADGRVQATLHEPPLFPSPVVCYGDDLADLAAEVRLTIARRKGSPTPRRAAP